MLIHTPADFCQSLGLPVTAVPDLIDTLRQRELAELAAHEARMRRLAGAPASNRIPLMDEAGDEFGRVEARIPTTLFFNVGQRYGFEAWEDDSFLKETLRDYPQFRINTVSPRGKLVTGYRGPERTVIKRY
jgi:hypothetical protein